MKLYVQYGAGLTGPPAWKNFDSSPTLRLQRLPIVGRIARRYLAPEFPDVIEFGDIVKGLPVREQSCEAIYCSHVLEHLALEDMRTALRNTFDHLRPGGTFRLVVPDLAMIADSYVASGDDGAALAFMRATLLGVERRERGLGALARGAMGNSKHLWMWDHASMSAELDRAGFVDIQRAELGDSGDPMFDAVEDADRWSGSVGLGCKRPLDR